LLNFGIQLWLIFYLSKDNLFIRIPARAGSAFCRVTGGSVKAKQNRRSGNIYAK